MFKDITRMTFAPEMGGGAGAPAAPSGPAPSGPGPESIDSTEVVGSDEPMPQGDPNDPDVEEDGEDAHVPYRHDAHYKALRNKNRKLQRRLAESRAASERLQTLGNVDELTYKARSYDNVRALLEQHPHLKAVLNGQAPQQGTAPQRPQAQMPEIFAEGAFPFDRNDPGGKYLYNVMQHMRQQYVSMAMLMRDLQGAKAFQQAAVHERAQTTQKSWVQARDAAAAKLPKNVQNVFKDAVYGAYQETQRRGVQMDVQKVIDHYLRDFATDDKQQKVASNAAAQRIAEHNKQLPRKQAMVGGAPAPASDRSKERVGDISRRLLGRRAS